MNVLRIIICVVLGFIIGSYVRRKFGKNAEWIILAVSVIALTLLISIFIMRQ